MILFGDVETFRAGQRGPVLGPDDGGYEECRKIFNGMIDKRPAVIARCVDIDDVINSVNFARAGGLLVAVRGGGHNVAGNSVCDGGLLIDLSPMKRVEVDAVARRARVDLGVTLGELDRASQEFGLATPLGTVSSTGVAGLTLGGGIGWLNGKYGLACDNLLSAQMVTAEGRLLRASPDEHADLYWGLRGGGGNFGVVTSFEYQLHPVGQVLGGELAWEISQAAEVLRGFREFAHTCPDELGTMVEFSTGLGGGQTMMIVVCHCGGLAEGLEAVQPLRRLGQPNADLVQPMSYQQIQSIVDDQWPPGRLHYWKSSYLTELTDDAIDTMLAFVAWKPSPLTTVGLLQMHGAASRIPPHETAFAQRAQQYFFGIYSVWTDPADSGRNIDWTRQFWEAMAPFAGRSPYINELSDTDSDLVKAAYGDNHDRLTTIKEIYDPTNFFRLNHNISPRAHDGEGEGLR